MLTALKAALGIAPKTLPQATETLAASTKFADAVSTLFTTAGLNLEQMLAAGSDSLKAHIEGLDNSDELAEALQENERLSANLAKANEGLTFANSVLEAHAQIFESIGVARPAGNAAFDGKTIKAQFEAHVAKQTTLKLAKSGHPPAHVPKIDAPETAVATDEQLLAEYEKMEAGDKRLAFYSKHEAALNRAAKARRTK